MDRRDFIISAAALGAPATAQTSGPAPTRSQYFTLRYYKLHQGDQGRRMNDWMSKSLLPAMKKHGFGTTGVFNVSVGPSPMMVLLTCYESLPQLEACWGRLGGDPEFRKSMEALEADAEPPYDRLEANLLRATDYSMEPKVAAERPKTPRVFELRIYESDTIKRQLALNQRFRDHTVMLFAKHGFDQLFYGTTDFGANMPNLTYLLAFESMAARDAAWAAFRADPDWNKAREASVKESGQIASRITNWILTATSYSPIQ